MSILSGLLNNNLLHISEYKKENHLNKVICKCCKTKLIPKQGTKKIHHFAHKSNEECDNWYMSDYKSEWHLMWQNVCKKENLEFIITRDNKKHIADIINSHNLIIEIQHSPIQENHVRDREKFYNNMIWIFDGYPENKNSPAKILVYAFFKQDNDKYYIIKTQRSFWTTTNKKSFIDSNLGLFKIIKVCLNGYIVAKKIDIIKFLTKYFDSILNDKKSAYHTLEAFREKYSEVSLFYSPFEELNKVHYEKNKCILTGYNLRSLSGESGILRKMGFDFNKSEHFWYYRFTEFTCSDCGSIRQKDTTYGSYIIEYDNGYNGINTLDIQLFCFDHDDKLLCYHCFDKTFRPDQDQYKYNITIKNDNVVFYATDQLMKCTHCDKTKWKDVNIVYTCSKCQRSEFINKIMMIGKVNKEEIIKLSVNELRGMYHTHLNLNRTCKEYDIKCEVKDLTMDDKKNIVNVEEEEIKKLKQQEFEEEQKLKLELKRIRQIEFEEKQKLEITKQLKFEEDQKRRNEMIKLKKYEEIRTSPIMMAFYGL